MSQLWQNKQTTPSPSYHIQIIDWCYFAHLCWHFPAMLPISEIPDLVHVSCRDDFPSRHLYPYCFCELLSSNYYTHASFAFIKIHDLWRRGFSSQTLYRSDENLTRCSFTKQVPNSGHTFLASLIILQLSISFFSPLHLVNFEMLFYKDFY